MNMTRIAVIILAFWCIFSCKNKYSTDNIAQDDKTNEPTYMRGEAYGSTFSIIYYGYGNNYNQDIQAILDAFDESVNTYRPDSYLSKFNDSGFGTDADSMLVELVDMSKDYNLTSNGYFDPSVQPLSDLWGFSKTELKHKPSQKKIDSVMQFVGLEHVQILRDSLIKDDARFRLSFNSITGYVNDKIASFLNKKEVENYLIEIGGEVYALGQKPDGSAWTVGIDEPISDGDRKINTLVELHNEALATSGNYRKFILNPDTGEKIVHTINPKTGEAKPSKLLSATVIASSTAEADAMATATMAMGYDMALEFIKTRPELKFYLIWQNADGKLEHQAFNGFEYEYLED